MADAFLMVDNRVELFYRSGKPYTLPEIDEVFPNPENRWMSDYLRSYPTELKPAIRSRALEHLRLLDLYFRVRYPRIAAHFGR